MATKRFGSVREYTTTQGKRYSARWTAAGKECQKRGFLKKSEASAYLSRLQYQIETNQYVENDKITLGAWLDVWIEQYCTDLKQSTVHGYLNYVNRIKAHPIGRMELQKINPSDIAKLYKDFRSKELRVTRDKKETVLQPLSEKSLEQVHRILHVALKYAVIDNKIYRNPCALVKKPRGKRFPHTVLAPQEATELLEKLKDTDVYIPVLLATAMGLRRGEVLGLTWPDVDFKNSTMTIRYNRVGVGKEEIVSSPKSEKSNRTLWMPEMVLRALKRFKLTSIANITENPRRFVCVDSHGIPFAVNYFSNQYKMILKDLGLPDMRFHDLRHSCVALLIAAGANPKEISEYLGHSEIGITMNLYGDLFDEYKKQTASAMDKILSGQG